MILNIDAASDTGLRRKNNEDMILIGDKYLRNDIYQGIAELDENKPYVLAVADGMGGHKSGDIASQLVAEGVYEIVKGIGRGKSPSEIKSVFATGITNLHNILLARSEAEPGLRSMGSTLVSVVFYENQIFLINAGDSRCYRFRNGILKQFTTDHSLSAITGIERSHSKALINSVGGGDSVFIDFWDVTTNFATDDRIILCSDGLHDMVDDLKIEAALINNPKCEPLIELALKAGGADNISIIIAELKVSK